MANGMKRRYRVLIAFAAVAVAMAGIVAAFYAEEDLRGARTWDATRRELAAQGESLDAADFIPPPVPDDENLAMIPAFARAFDYQVDPRTKAVTFGPAKESAAGLWRLPYGSGAGRPKGTTHGGWKSGRPMPLADVQRYYATHSDLPHPEQPGTAADDVLFALSKGVPELDEIEAAAALRPRMRFPVEWNHSPPASLRLPHLNLVQKIVGALRLRAIAQLDAGRHVEAARELATAFRLRASAQAEPTLVAHLVTITCDGLLLQPIWEGLAARRWTAAELRDLQAELRSDDLLADFARTIRGERALFFCPTMELVRQAGTTRALANVAVIEEPSGKTRDSYRKVATFFPGGWIDLAEAGGCTAYQEYVSELVSVRTRRVAAGRLKELAAQREREKGDLSPPRMWTRIMHPLIDSVVEKTAQWQTACEEAETACALERYFLDHQSYPETLGALVPAYLDRVPTDLIDGAPMRYRRTEDGRYLVYGIGWNERDDGGKVAWLPSAAADDAAEPDREKGDWVWQYTPANPEEGRRW